MTLRGSFFVAHGLLLVLLAAPRTAAAAEPRDLRTVVAIYWGSGDFPSNAVVHAALAASFREHPDLAIDLFGEYLESDRFPEEQASLALRDSIRRKYAGRRIDAVVALTEPAQAFVLRFRDEIFPGVPIVTSGTSAPPAALRASGAGLAAVTNGRAYRETLELALRLHPATSRVFVVAHWPDHSFPALLRTELEPIARRVPLAYIDEPSVPRLIAAVKAVPAGSLILYIRHTQEEPGHVLIPADGARLVAGASAVPVYGIFATHLGSGLVGGIVGDARTTGERVGAVARRVLEGERPQDIPVQPVPRVPMFDWRQLRRWGIDASQLPAGSEVRFEVVTIWDAYGWYIVGAAGLTLAQGFMIVALVVERARRRQSQERHELASAAGAVGVWDWNLATGEIYVDPFLTRTLGYAAGEIGHHIEDWFRLVHPDDIQVVRARILDVIESRSPDYEVELRVLDRHGGYRWFMARGSAVYRHGRAVRLTGTNTDITERKLSQRVLEHTQAELTRVSRLTALGEFAASIAHEVRQPLTTIVLNAKACLHWLSGGAPDITEVRAALTDVVDAGKRADELIQRNRALFRQHTVQHQSLDLEDLVGDVVDLARARLQWSGVRLTTSLAVDLPLVTGDRIELQQVLLNLVGNAIDATAGLEPGLRRIEILAALSPDRSVTVSVRDNGVGLEGVDMRRLFSLSYTTKPGGAGIGLSLCRSIVEAHGGRVWPEQNPDGGATFSFTIPLVAGAVPLTQLPSGPVQAI